MNRVTKFLSACAITVSLALTATPAFAAKPPPKVNPPTLHGFCSLADPCTDNGTNTPTGVNPPEFGFSYSGTSGTGDFWVDILVPNSVAAPGSFTITGALSGTASLFKPTAWTSGQLDAFLGITASPTNPIGAYLPATLLIDPSATGFWVFQADLGNTTLLAQSGVGQAGQDDYLLQLGQGLAPGSYIVGFLEQTDKFGATANSGAILETGTDPHLPEPGTWAMMLVGFGAAGVSMRRSRRRKALLTQLA